MSGKDKAKAELTAIYRLEFYRKQSNWKLYDKKKSKKKSRAAAPPPPAEAPPPPPAEIRQILNETYNVECPKTDAASSLHNNAFLESDSNIAQCDSETHTDRPLPSSVPTQQQDNTNITDTNKPQAVKKRSRIWNIPWSELQDAWSEDQRDGGQELWSGRSEVWLNAALNPNDNIPTPPQLGEPPDLSEDPPIGDSPLERPWTLKEELTWIDDHSSIEDQFMLEADLGSHSTALSHIVQETPADALRELLAYAERHVELPSYDSGEELPTRDDVTYFTRHSTKIPDVLLRGSHNNNVHYTLDAARFRDGFVLDSNVGIMDRNVESDSNTGQYDSNVGQYDRNVGQYDRNVGQYDTNVGQYDRNVGQYDTNVGKYDTYMGQYDTNIGQYDTNVKQYDKNYDQYNIAGQYDVNAGHYDRNVEKNCDINQNIRNLYGIGQYASNIEQYDNFDQYDKNNQYQDFNEASHLCKNNNNNDLNSPQWGYLNDFKINQEIDRNNNGIVWEGRGRGRGRNNNNQAIIIGQGRPYRMQ